MMPRGVPRRRTGGARIEMLRNSISSYGMTYTPRRARCIESGSCTTNRCALLGRVNMKKPKGVFIRPPMVNESRTGCTMSFEPPAADTMEVRAVSYASVRKRWKRLDRCSCVVTGRTSSIRRRGKKSDTRDT